MAVEDIEALQARARAGDAGAFAELGRRALVGDEVAQSKEDAVRLLEEGAGRGSGEAVAVLGLLSAYGIARPYDLGEALDNVARAAEMGWEPSQRELRFLAGVSAGDDWAALRSQVDPASWLESPDVRMLSTAPRIGVIEGFARPAECEWLMARAAQHLKPAPLAGGGTAARARSCTEAAFNVRIADTVLALIRERMAGAMGIAVKFFQTTKLLHYAPGQQFPEHADFFDTSDPAAAEEVRRNGQRVATFLLYLNDGYEGGETEFPRAGIRHKGKRGEAVLFTSVDSNGAPDYATLHAGLAPTRGEKWLLSQWVRNKPVF